jgi:hypothetical protein
VTVWLLPDEDDDDEEEELSLLVVVIVRSSGCATSAGNASTRLTWDREDMDGRRRRLGRRTGGAGAVREGIRAAGPWDCVRVDVPTGLIFEGDLAAELTRVDVDAGAGACVWATADSGFFFEGDLVGLAIAALAFLRLFSSSSSALSKSNIFANPRLWPILGESTKMSMSFVGAGVAMGSPVVVRITPFMADTTGNAGAKRSAGVSKGRRVERVGEIVLGRGVLCGSLVVSCASGASMFFTSSSGVLSLF